MPAALVAVLVVLLLPSLASAQRAACGGHRVEWVGGSPRAMFDRGPAHGTPVVEQPDEMSVQDRELWDALVYDDYDNQQSMNVPLEQRHTRTMSIAQARSFNLCIQSDDHSYSGERMSPYANAGWWREHVERFTQQQWTGELRRGECTGDPPNGWVYAREGEEGEVQEDRLAHARSWRYRDPHRNIAGEWVRGEIVWHSAEKVRNTQEHWIESTLAHELGHILGLYHVPPSSGFIMVGGGIPRRGRADKERWLAQWAYYVGPGVEYPGFVRPDTTEPGDLKGGVKDLVDEALEDLQDDSDARHAAQEVPALPTTGMLLLATLLGLLGRGILRAE